MRATLTVFTILGLALSIPALPADEPPAAHVELFNRMLSGTKCHGVPNNGMWCSYKIGTLEISIKDVGGADTVIAFVHSDSKEEFYAVMYFGCVSVIPTKIEAAKHDRNFGVFISPTTGRVYMTPNECRAASSSGMTSNTSLERTRER